jgi:hypothetical protein
MNSCGRAGGPGSKKSGISITLMTFEQPRSQSMLMSRAAGCPPKILLGISELLKM